MDTKRPIVRAFFELIVSGDHYFNENALLLSLPIDRECEYTVILINII